MSKSGTRGGNGTGTIHESGYRKIVIDGVSHWEHRLIWERAYGPLPPGVQVHHKNHDKLDNRIENLKAVDPTAHKRIHSGCFQRDGVWWKPCKVCRKYKPVGSKYWYLCKKGRPMFGKCRLCHIRAVTFARKRRKSPPKKSPKSH